MRLSSLLLSTLILIIACSPDDETPDNPGGLTGEAATPTYDESLIPEPQPLNNLISNGDFESDEAWFTCGGAQVGATDQGQSLIINTTQECSEAGGITFTVNAVAAQEIELTAVPELLTVSFLVRAEGAIPSLDFNVFLTNAPNGTYGFGTNAYFLGAPSQEEGGAGGWNRINFLVTRQDINTWLDAPSPLFVVFEAQDFTATSSTTIYIDDVIVTEGVIRLTQPSPMPDALQNYAGNSQLIFYDLSPEEKLVATMLPNGTDRVIFNQVDATIVDGSPQWFDDNQFVLSQKVFNPEAPSDATVVPGGGSDVTRYNSIDGSQEVVYITRGEPGVFNFSGAVDNRAALDVEVRRTAWDVDRNRGILNVCGRNRSPEFGLNSDDICWLYLFDTNTNEVLNDEVYGFAPKWSSSGKLAYYYDNQLFVAEVSGSAITPQVVYQRSGLLQALDWSPDESTLVFAEVVSSSGIINSEDVVIYAIKTLDIATGQTELLLQADHGDLLPNLSWSPDGDFIIYSMNTEQGAQIWWLEVATGTTGPITNTTNGYAVTWRK